MVEISPSRSLEIFDDLDLAKIRERRLALYALEDYFGSILSALGTEYLSFSSNTAESGIGSQWNRAKRRLESEGIEVEEDYTRILNQLNTQRNNVAHNYQENPDRELLIEARDIALDWSNWFNDVVRIYDNKTQEQTKSVAEEMGAIAREAARTAKVPTDMFGFDDLRDEQSEINRQVEFLLSQLSRAMKTGDKVDRYLVRKLQRALELKERHKSLIKKNGNRLEKETRFANEEPDFRFCTVIEPANEEDPEIRIEVRDRLNTQNEFWINPDSHPEGKKKSLRELSQGDLLEVVLSTDISGDSFVEEVIIK